MIQIPIETIDSKIWHPETVAMQLVKALQSGPVTIDLLWEGPCCDSSGIDDLLIDVCDSFDFNHDMITVQTSNQVSSSRFKEIRTGFVELDYCQQFARINPYQHNMPTRKFGMFVSRSNWKRLALSSYLWTNYRDTSTCSFHFDITNNYHQANFGLEKLLIEEIPEYDILDFLTNLPLRFNQHSYPIQYHTGALDLGPQYRDIFCDIVCETYFTGKTFFVTEKTWRPIIYRRPFIVQGPQWYLKNLKHLGFRTFSDWWPEGYDEDVDGGTLESIRKLIDFIASQSQDTVNQWLEDMQPTLDHNYLVFSELRNTKILDNTFYDR